MYTNAFASICVMDNGEEIKKSCMNSFMLISLKQDKDDDDDDDVCSMAMSMCKKLCHKV